MKTEWLQINVAFARQEFDADASARAVFDALAPILATWRRSRALHGFFFMRKPPDLRLRFLGPDPETQLLSTLRPILRRLRRDGFIRHAYRSVYEPETRLFGGPAAMRLIHHHFDRDSRTWISLDELTRAERRAPLPPDVLPSAVLNDLFIRAIADKTEIWDIWRNLEMLTKTGESSHCLPDPPRIIAVPTLLPLLPPAEAAIVARYEAANAALAAGLRRLSERGRLRAGLRGILSFVAMFHLNRHGFDGPRQALLASGMSSAWDPHRGLH